jgi:hypothetical protein
VQLKIEGDIHLFLSNTFLPYSGCRNFMPLPLKSKILETPGLKCFHYEFGHEFAGLSHGTM